MYYWQDRILIECRFNWIYYLLIKFNRLDIRFFKIVSYLVVETLLQVTIRSYYIRWREWLFCKGASLLFAMKLYWWAKYSIENIEESIYLTKTGYHYKQFTYFVVDSYIRILNGTIQVLANSLNSRLIHYSLVLLLTSSTTGLRMGWDNPIPWIVGFFLRKKQFCFSLGAFIFPWKNV